MSLITKRRSYQDSMFREAMYMSSTRVVHWMTAQPECSFENAITQGNLTKLEMYIHYITHVLIVYKYVVCLPCYYIVYVCVTGK